MSSFPILQNKEGSYYASKIKRKILLTVTRSSFLEIHRPKVACLVKTEVPCKRRGDNSKLRAHASKVVKLVGQDDDFTRPAFSLKITFKQ